MAKLKINEDSVLVSDTEWKWDKVSEPSAQPKETPDTVASYEKLFAEMEKKMAEMAKQIVQLTAKAEANKLVEEEANELIETREALDDFERAKRIFAAEKRITIMIPTTETQKKDVDIGINGYVIKIKRDEKASIPISFYKVLKDAKETFYTQEKRANGEGERLVPFHVLRHQFQVLSELEH